jgi:hypothetical protein
VNLILAAIILDLPEQRGECLTWSLLSSASMENNGFGSKLGKTFSRWNFGASPSVPTADFAPAYTAVLIPYSSIACNLNGGLDGIS